MPTDKALALVDEVKIKINKQLKAIEIQLGKDQFDLLITMLEEAQMILKDKGDI